MYCVSDRGRDIVTVCIITSHIKTQQRGELVALISRGYGVGGFGDAEVPDPTSVLRTPYVRTNGTTACYA
jgi:hypothetical protein